MLLRQRRGEAVEAKPDAGPPRYPSYRQYRLSRRSYPTPPLLSNPAPSLRSPSASSSCGGTS